MLAMAILLRHQNLKWLAIYRQIVRQIWSMNVYDNFDNFKIVSDICSESTVEMNHSPLPSLQVPDLIYAEMTSFGQSQYEWVVSPIVCQPLVVSNLRDSSTL